MSATDLKSILFKQIERIDKEEDLHDLLLTVTEFVNYRANPEPESAKLLSQLQRALTSVEMGHLTPHDQVVKESKQWLIR
jgi:hypothetical protein